MAAQLDLSGLEALLADPRLEAGDVELLQATLDAMVLTTNQYLDRRPSTGDDAYWRTLIALERERFAR